VESAKIKVRASEIQKLIVRAEEQTAALHCGICRRSAAAKSTARHGRAALVIYAGVINQIIGSIRA
jgi:hypothetical protein